jgi:phosphoadenosine phosphosulfate reductase
MERLAAQAADDLADAPAQEVIAWAAQTFGARVAITSSMTDAVIIHLAAAVQPGIDVIFLDTGGLDRLPGERDQRHAIADRRGAGRRAGTPAVRAEP